MIYLVPEVRSGLGEDTFWTWFKREFADSSFDLPAEIGADDWILQYATLGPSRVKGGKKAALLWELYPEMKKRGFGGDDYKIAAMKSCAQASDLALVATPSMLEFFPTAQYVPIGVDTDLFRPMNKAKLRRKHGFGNGEMGFWYGTAHPMKGHAKFIEYAAAHPQTGWIEVFKHARLPQSTLAEFMNCADFVLFTGGLRPYFMAEWEAMACDVPVVDISGVEREFVPGEHPREDVLRAGWSRDQAKQEWAELLCVN